MRGRLRRRATNRSAGGSRTPVRASSSSPTACRRRSAGSPGICRSSHRFGPPSGSEGSSISWRGACACHRASSTPSASSGSGGSPSSRTAGVALGATSAFIKEIGLADRTVAVAYCHSPTRYLYDWSERYLQEEVPQPLVPLVRELLGRLRDDDQRAARRFDRWMANSTVVRGRIETYYGVAADTIEIVHPPVDVASFAANDERGDFWLFVGRLSSYKRADVAVRAFNEIGLRLLVVGEGRERGALERMASENVVFTGRADDATLRSLLASARGLVFPAEDDFGIVCAEALAAGAPVVALAAGGVFDIVRDGEEGGLSDVPEARALAEGVLRAERAHFEPRALRDSARRFDVSRFRERVRAVVGDAHEKGRVT